MTIVQDITTCPGCGEELELLTDGRLAYVSAVDESGDTSEVWRDGHLLVARCPAVDRLSDETCHERVEFTGEGPVLREGQDIYGFETFAEPILEEQP